MALTDTEPLTPFENLLNAVVSALNERLQAGSATGSPASGASDTVPVVFDTAFPVPPKVTSNPVGGSSVANLIRVIPANVTETGFDLIFWRDSGSTSTITAHWTAVLP